MPAGFGAPCLKAIAFTFAALVAIIWFRTSTGSGIKARFEAAQATEIARAVRVEAARHRAIEDELEHPHRPVRGSQCRQEIY